MRIQFVNVCVRAVRRSLSACSVIKASGLCSGKQESLCAELYLNFCREKNPFAATILPAKIFSFFPGEIFFCR